LADAIAQALPSSLATSCNLKADPSDSGTDMALSRFLSQAAAGTLSEELRPDGFWLHSPCGAPLTALWLHR
jgi:hypothetical protein